LLSCEENREQITKSNIKLLTQIFSLLSILKDFEVADFVPKSSSSSGGSDFYLFDLAL